MDRNRLSIQITQTEEQSKGKKGVSLYLMKDKAYTFIETTPAQRFQIKCAITQRKHPIPKALVETTEEEYVDILQLF